MTPQEALERAIEYFGQRNHTATAWDYTDETKEEILIGLRKLAPPEEGMPSRDEIIEECARVCEARAEENPDGSYKRDVDEEAGKCAYLIRALKSSEPQGQ